MKKRSPLAVFLLSIITLGIYDIYWLVSTKKVLNQKTSHKIPSVWLLFSPLILIIISYVLLVIGTVNSISNYSTTKTHNGLYAIGLILLIVGAISGLVISIVWFFKYSKAVNEYTSGKMSTAVSFLVLFIIHLIGVALIQDAFNDVAAAPAGGAPMNPSMPMNSAPPQAPMAPSEPSQQPMATQPTETAQPVSPPPAEPPSDPMAPPTSGQL